MTEASLTSALVKLAREQLRGAVVLKHADSFTYGIPDLSVTWHGKTTWWEVKFADPGLQSSGVQDKVCMQLAAAGFCRYIVYHLLRDTKRTLIVHPKDLADWRGVPAECWCTGFDHRWVLQHIRAAHLIQ